MVAIFMNDALFRSLRPAMPGIHPGERQQQILGMQIRGFSPMTIRTGGFVVISRIHEFC
jgi:hypothetical protein